MGLELSKQIMKHLAVAFGCALALSRTYCDGFLTPHPTLQPIRFSKMASTSAGEQEPSRVATTVTPQQASEFAHAWFEAWEARDLDAILLPFTDDVEFHSPLVERITGDPSGVIHDKVTLRQYFQAALDAYPKIDKEIYDVLVGVESIAVYYRSVNKMMSCEVFFIQKSAEDAPFQCHKVLNNYRAHDVSIDAASTLCNEWIAAWNSRNFGRMKKHLLARKLREEYWSLRGQGQLRSFHLMSMVLGSGLIPAETRTSRPRMTSCAPVFLDMMPRTGVSKDLVGESSGKRSP